MCDYCSCGNDDVIRAAMSVGDCSLCPHTFVDPEDGLEYCNILEEEVRPCNKF